MRIFKTKSFARFAGKEDIDDDVLRDAVDRAERNLIDADLGGFVIKQRVARPGKGKSGGYRTIILFRHGDKAFFVHGFAKSDADNIDSKELAAFKVLAHEMLGYDESMLAQALKTGALVEVEEDGEEEDSDDD